LCYAHEPHESQQWLENQIEKRLPCKYYLITFTLPEHLRDLAWKHQKIVYALMFEAVQDLLKSFTHNDKKLAGSPGFTAILHTQSRTLDDHPHIHVIMPGASVSLKTRLWKEKSGKYLFSHKALAKVFRAKLLQALVENKLPVPHECPKKWSSLVRNRKPPPAILCPVCGAPMVIIATRIARPRVFPAILGQQVNPETLPM
jgi:hypothetical protein